MHAIYLLIHVCIICMLPIKVHVYEHIPQCFHWAGRIACPRLKSECVCMSAYVWLPRWPSRTWAQVIMIYILCIWLYNIANLKVCMQSWSILEMTAVLEMELYIHAIIYYASILLIQFLSIRNEYVHGM